ncbi:DUF1223 domain-containing protein [Methylophaga sp. OBS4]|uniref:DUF1223 domain-containing protein n=1 Tax=Methylophaga sp. OBS4 TaxID=2991935 RepID=UPI0022578164|nr:DUF1223 domain-containing protein [Methylophaga sp. OBS4]MCX4187804.1 DUF1223 domain-containing protein [Methylophaga sp. OBS4]
MLKIKQYLLLGLLALFLPPIAVAEEWQAQSTDKQLAVMELFTSEGCGLCPAADRWVQRLPQQGITEEQLIVLGFHIDYLNDAKGWIDRFAKPLFSERQRQLARLNLYQTVFTPEIFISGEVVHNWQKHGIDVIEFVNSFAPIAHIKLNVEKQASQLHVSSKISVSGDENRDYSKLYLAITEDNIVSEIHGGDNIGAIFNHQNLVRAWLGPFDLDKDGETELNTQIALDQDWDLNNLKLVAVVQNLYDGYVLQGLSLPLSN